MFMSFILVQSFILLCSCLHFCSHLVYVYASLLESPLSYRLFRQRYLFSISFSFATSNLFSKSTVVSFSCLSLTLSYLLKAYFPFCYCAVCGQKTLQLFLRFPKLNFILINQFAIHFLNTNR